MTITEKKAILSSHYMKISNLYKNYKETAIFFEITVNQSSLV